MIRGASRLAFDAVEQLTDIVEAMHANIAAGAPPVGRGTDGRTRGITGMVYGSIRLVNAGSRAALDHALGRLKRKEGSTLPPGPNDAIVSAVNGVLGDYLADTSNPLAIEMQLRRDGRPLTLEREALAAALPEAGARLLLVVHGLCMSDRQQCHRDHDHGAELARELDLTPVYLHYNSGRHVSENGRELATLLERLLEAWPEEVTEVNVLAHSMGGLVARSACHYANLADHRWPSLLRRIVFLGTPHHGAPMERGGSLLQTILSVSPYTEPLARLGWLRSAGITDLRYGNLLDEDWQGRDRFSLSGDRRQAVPLPANASCHVVAATTGQGAGDLKDRLIGDGLVPVSSALGRHDEEARTLPIPESRQSVFYRANHLDLLSSPEVYAQLREWYA